MGRNIRIKETLKELGVSPNLCGYYYLEEAISLTIDDPALVHGQVTKVLYPCIAKKFKTTTSRVERAIRHAIGVSGQRGNVELIEKIFSYSTDYNRGKATNSEYIATVADYLRGIDNDTHN